MEFNNQAILQNDIYFRKLIAFLKGESVLNVTDLFQKNLSLLKQNIKSKITLTQQLPSLKEICLLYCSKIVSKKSYKSFFKKTKIFLIWLISTYEAISKKCLEEFTNKDWETISLMFPNSDVHKLKFKFFSYLNLKKNEKKWTELQDVQLQKLIKKLYPNLFEQSKTPINFKISWSQVSFELSKELQNFHLFKSDKQCKERWLNHLNPFLNKNLWSLNDDIKLMEESLTKTKKWALLAKEFIGRTQHHIKNRFISVLNQELGLKRETVRDLLKKKTVLGFISKVLNVLKMRKLDNVLKAKKIENAHEIIESPETIENEPENSRNIINSMNSFDQVSSFIDFNSENTNSTSENFNIDHYINYN